MIERVLNPIKARIRLMVGKCLITACGGDTVDLSLLAGENRDDVDFYQHYGFSSRPVGKVGGVALFIGGSRDNGVVVASRGEDKEMKMDLEPGEVALHTRFGSSVVLRNDGSIEISSEGDVFVNTGNGIGDLCVNGGVKATLDVKAMSDSAPVSLAMHTHASAVGPTAPPTPGA